MIQLFCNDQSVKDTGTVFVNRPCQVKKLRLVTSNTSACYAIFRDGSATGEIKGRLYVAGGTRGQISDTVECNENEIINFATNIFVQVAGDGFVQAYTMGNPVGTQGS